MFELILKQIKTIIKVSNSELRKDLIKEMRTSEALIRSDIALRYPKAKKTQILPCSKRR